MWLTSVSLESNSTPLHARSIVVRRSFCSLKCSAPLDALSVVNACWQLGSGYGKSLRREANTCRQLGISYGKSLYYGSPSRARCRTTPSLDFFRLHRRRRMECWIQTMTSQHMGMGLAVSTIVNPPVRSLQKSNYCCRYRQLRFRPLLPLLSRLACLPLGRRPTADHPMTIDRTLH